MTISTTNQKVDQKRFNKSHDKTFRNERKSRPGKTTYVMGPNGHITPKDQNPHWITAIDPAGGPDYAVIDKLQLQALGK